VLPGPRPWQQAEGQDLLQVFTRSSRPRTRRRHC